MGEKTVLLRQLVTRDGLTSSIEMLDPGFTPIIHHALKADLSAECSELATSASESPSIRSYSMVKKVPAMLLIYKENYRK